YSNATRGRLKKQESQPEFHIIEDESPKNLNRSWARLIMKIYEVDPLICPQVWRGYEDNCLYRRLQNCKEDS
ncbi:MAG: hypothetical protein WA097_00830, partial [Candidatus Hydromicrobium sp.]